MKVDMGDFEFAKDKVMMGSERRSLAMSEEEKRNTAYHEAGHVVVGKSLAGADPVHKVTIIPRGRALGLTQQLPEEDRYLSRKPIWMPVSGSFSAAVSRRSSFSGPRA